MPVTVGTDALVTLSKLLGSSGLPDAELNLVTPGDENGLIHYLGSKGNTSVFSNPAGSDYLLASQSSEYNSSYGVANLTDRDPTTVANTLNAPNSFWAWDLGAGHQIRVSSYTVQFRGDGTTANSPVEWALQGSNDGTTWITLDPRVGQTPVIGGYVTCTLDAMPDAYRHLRLLQTGLNAASNNMFILAEVEFYGSYLTVGGDGEPGGSGIDRLTTFESTLLFESASRLMAYGAGTVEAGNRGLRVYTSTAAGASDQVAEFMLNTGNTVVAEEFAFSSGGGSFGSAGRALVGWATGGATTVAEVLTYDFVGVVVNNTSGGVITVEFVTANNLDSESTALTGQGSGHFRVRLVDGAWECWQDGVLVATHSTQVPDETNLWTPFCAGIHTDAGSGTNYFEVESYYFRYSFT